MDPNVNNPPNGPRANGPTGGGKKDLLCAYNQQAFIVTGIEAIE
jgi:hypothetical protein